MYLFFSCGVFLVLVGLGFRLFVYFFVFVFETKQSIASTLGLVQIWSSKLHNIINCHAEVMLHILNIFSMRPHYLIEEGVGRKSRFKCTLLLSKRANGLLLSVGYSWR